ncbi:uncharacterized protein TRAVEDRAFT_21517 [Trametes versicolor FP-101664 SS1]|uniref:uncharacterized protein n=1 Tax=Trametes versicolor (strain FP-101664) TaxID=717944 RepID=UPI0004622333|nr:uncharacterized protein TRAVEDRAFT_21517 [Trametes versicolor FP-101664 SS1]EIW56292.1 hypothetical protein TRAVEDRAFT_21517 [Trametes versicolor FP-101664 SS1]
MNINQQSIDDSDTFDRPTLDNTSDSLEPTAVPQQSSGYTSNVNVYGFPGSTCHSVPVSDIRAHDVQTAGVLPFQESQPIARLPESVYDSGTHSPARHDGHMALHKDDADNSLMVIPQKLYRLPRHQRGGALALQSISIYVAVRDALQPKVLARKLVDPLRHAFHHAGGGKSREGQKFTIRCVFRLDGDAEVVNARPVQINEYMAGSQSSLAVEAAWDLYPMLRKASGRVPLMRVALVEKVATELRAFLIKLKEQNKPLVFRGREVEYDHLLIVSISRPTAATVQPKLAILPRYRNLYLGNARDVSP